MQETSDNTQNRIPLNPEKKSPKAEEFENRLGTLIVGQERAVRRISGLYQIFLAGMQNPGRPIGTMLSLGPTGSGKTRVVEAAAEVLFDDTNAVVKIDCAEFQHSHEIAKLIGSPPGYLGHRETAPMLTQENLDKYHTENDKLTFVLFDEIEKASEPIAATLFLARASVKGPGGDGARLSSQRHGDDIEAVHVGDRGDGRHRQRLGGPVGGRPQR